MDRRSFLAALLAAVLGSLFTAGTPPRAGRTRDGPLECWPTIWGDFGPSNWK